MNRRSPFRRAWPQLSEFQFFRAAASLRARGLIGHLSLVVDDTFRLDGISIRRTAAGRLTLSFPRRFDRRGRKHYYSQPIDDDARRSIESRVFEQIGDQIPRKEEIA